MLLFPKNKIWSNWRIYREPTFYEYILLTKHRVRLPGWTIRAVVSQVAYFRITLSLPGIELLTVRAT